jgi:hypothetical protein
MEYKNRVSLICAVLFLSGCFDEEKKTMPAVIDERTSYYLQSFNDLPTCNPARAFNLAFVASSKTFYVCSSQQVWNAIDATQFKGEVGLTGATGPMGPTGPAGASGSTDLLPYLRITSGTVPTDAADSVKNSACVSEYGVQYDAATIQETLMNIGIRRTLNHTFRGSTNGWWLEEYDSSTEAQTNRYYPTGTTNAARTVPCILKAFQFRITTSKLSKTSTSTERLNACINEFDSTFKPISTVEAGIEYKNLRFCSRDDSQDGAFLYASGLPHYLYCFGDYPWVTPSAANTAPVVCARGSP